MHSHNYTPQQAYKRSFGEAKALAAVWNDAPTEINFPKTVLLGWANDARRDLIFCAQQKRLREWPHAARIRWQQRRAKLAGFREGWKFYRNGNGSRSGRREEAPSFPLKKNGASSRRLLRFTMDGSEALENHLARICEKVLEGVQGVIPERQTRGAGARWRLWAHHRNRFLKPHLARAHNRHRAPAPRVCLSESAPARPRELFRKCARDDSPTHHCHPS